jgi:integrating conjugative element protein (TIGR03758 family)
MSVDISSVFQSSAGIAPSELSLVIRTFTFSLIAFWAGWAIHGQYNLYNEGQIEFTELPLKILRVLLICSVLSIVVYVA